MNPYEKEIAERGRRYYRKQRMWEYVEGAVIVILSILAIIAIVGEFTGLVDSVINSL